MTPRTIALGCTLTPAEALRFDDVRRRPPELALDGQVRKPESVQRARRRRLAASAVAPSTPADGRRTA